MKIGKGNQPHHPLTPTLRELVSDPIYSKDPREQEIRAMLVATMRANTNRLGRHQVVLFGSRAQGKAKSRSDFDLGVVGDAPLPLEDFFAIQDMLDELPTLYRIDWVDFARVSERFRSQALQKVEVIYE